MPREKVPFPSGAKNRAGARATTLRHVCTTSATGDALAKGSKRSVLIQELGAVWPGALLGLMACACSPAAQPELASGELQSASVGRRANEPFTVSLQVGQHDLNGHFIGGTELINLADYGGKLYAGNGYWMDAPGGAPASGPQILVLDSPRGRWTEEHAFSDVDAEGKLVFGRLTALKTLTFATDGRGTPLTPPVTMLVVGLERRQAGSSGAIFARSERGRWTQIDGAIPAPFSVRALAVHRDDITGIDSLFVGAGAGESGQNKGAIYRGVFDPTAKGRIRVDATPEVTHFENRVMAFAEAAGRLLFSAKPGLYARTDGPNPSWTLAASVPTPVDPNAVRDGRNSGLRGLTVIGGNSPVVLGGLEGVGGPILRFDPSAAFAPSTEARIGDLLLPAWGLGPRQYIISAYNDMPRAMDPVSMRGINLIGLQAHNPSKPTSAWYLVRRETGDYTLHEVPALTPQSPYGLVAVRTIHVSPFPEDRGEVLYMGGCDADFRPSHNTAWLYRVGLRTALQ